MTNGFNRGMLDPLHRGRVRRVEGSEAYDSGGEQDLQRLPEGREVREGLRSLCFKRRSLRTGGETPKRQSLAPP